MKGISKNINAYKKNIFGAMNSPWLSFTDITKSEVGETYGVYLINNKDKNIIYVGKTSNLYKRLHSDLFMGNMKTHVLKNRIKGIDNLQNKKKETIQNYVQNYLSIQIIKCKTEREASFLEKFAIAAIKPKYNR